MSLNLQGFLKLNLLGHAKYLSHRNGRVGLRYTTFKTFKTFYLNELCNDYRYTYTILTHNTYSIHIEKKNCCQSKSVYTSIILPKGVFLT